MRARITAISMLMGLMLVVGVGCQTTPHVKPVAETGSGVLQVTSDPPGATVLWSPDETTGPWKEYWPKKGLHITPSESEVWMLGCDHFYVKVQKDGYVDSEPFLVRGLSDETQRIHAKLEPVGATYLYVDSKPEGATVFIAESLDGTYRPWEGAEGEPRTPARGKVAIGDTFWVRVEGERRKSDAEYVHIKSNLDHHVSFDLTNGQAEKVPITVTSDPPGATVLVSNAEFGVYQPWPPDAASQLTPIQTEIEVGQDLWMKLRKDKYQTSPRRLVRVKAGAPVTISEMLEPFIEPAPPSPEPAQTITPAPPQKPPQRECAGVKVKGYAPVGDDMAAARQAAVLDALSSAVQENYGGSISRSGVAQNYLLIENRIESLAEGEFESYEVLEESQDDGLYRVTVCVTFPGDVAGRIQDRNVTFLVGGFETVDLGPGAAFGSLNLRQALADSLLDASMGVTVKEDDIRSGRQLAREAGDPKKNKYQCDLALFVKGGTELHDKFGEFYSCKTTAEYQLLFPVAPSPMIPEDYTHIIAEGYVEGYNKERQLSLDTAAVHSLRDVSETVANEVIDKLDKRYDQAASHEVYVVGFLDQREIQTLEEELRRIPGVREARSLPFSRARSEDPRKDVHQVQLILTPDARPRIPSAVERLANVDLEVVESDLYNTVAYVLKPE